jgi:Leucine-rich repeat (LRR) protein
MASMLEWPGVVIGVDGADAGRVVKIDLGGKDLYSGCAPPPEFVNLTALQTLDLSGSRFSTLPAGFGNLAALQTLDLSDTRLYDLPVGFGNLTALQTLDLSGTRLGTLPVGFGNLASLQTLDLSDTRLGCPPPCVADVQTATLPAEFENLLDTLQTVDDWTTIQLYIIQGLWDKVA